MKLVISDRLDQDKRYLSKDERYCRQVAESAECADSRAYFIPLYHMRRIDISAELADITREG